MVAKHSSLLGESSDTFTFFGRVYCLADVEFEPHGYMVMSGSQWTTILTLKNHSNKIIFFNQLSRNRHFGSHHLPYSVTNVFLLLLVFIA